ncbi:hypothetical protein ACJRO7_001046 [Eucalyptus globulus]|uniref:Uncharacterized protein n=1 Tax=Eucalyptus globulus TaxID=34317 RepID=A0ABD3LPN6_EUCGL
MSLTAKYRAWLSLTKAAAMIATLDGADHRGRDIRQTRKLPDLVKTLDKAHHKICDVRPQTEPNFQMVAHQWPVLTARSRCHGRATVMGSIAYSKSKKRNSVLGVILRKTEPTTKDRW